MKYPRFDTKIIQMISELDADDTSDLCDAFEMMVHRLPDGIVLYFVVEDIAVHEVRGGMRTCEKT